MGIISILLIAVGLAMDSLAVSISGGIVMRPFCMRQSLRLAFTMGIFQGGMTLFGWLMGVSFSSYITAFDHWIAFILLGFIGGKMIWEAVHPEKEECEVNLPFSTILTQAIATSIDALAVGVSFALLEVNILSASVIIALTTLLCSLVGAYLGKAFGSLLKSKAEVFGGVILVLIGLKILLEHTILA